MRYSLLDRLGTALATLLGLVGVVVMLGPVLTTVILSFSESFNFPPRGFTLQWYAQFLGRPEFTSGLRVSLILALITVVVSLTLGTALALAIARHQFPGRAVVNFLILSPLSVPRVACGVAILLFFVSLDIRGSALRLLLLHLILACPYVVTVVTASLKGLDPSLGLAAMKLGASPCESFCRVTFPLIQPGVVAGGMFAFVVSFDEVTASMFLTDARTSTFPVVLFSYLERGSLDPTVAAASA